MRSLERAELPSKRDDRTVVALFGATPTRDTLPPDKAHPVRNHSSVDCPRRGSRVFVNIEATHLEHSPAARGQRRERCQAPEHSPRARAEHQTLFAGSDSVAILYIYFNFNFPK